MSKSFPNQSLNSVSQDIVARYALSHHQSKGTKSVVRVHGVQHEIPTGAPYSRPKHPIELSRSPEPARRWKAVVDGSRSAACNYTANRARPLARRALITARPARVFMRTRNPCVRFLRVTDG